MLPALLLLSVGCVARNSTETQTANNPVPAWEIALGVIGGISAICALVAFYWFHRQVDHIEKEFEKAASGRGDMNIDFGKNADAAVESDSTATTTTVESEGKDGTVFDYDTWLNPKRAEKSSDGKRSAKQQGKLAKFHMGKMGSKAAALVTRKKESNTKITKETEGYRFEEVLKSSQSTTTVSQGEDGGSEVKSEEGRRAAKAPSSGSDRNSEEGKSPTQKGNTLTHKIKSEIRKSLKSGGRVLSSPKAGKTSAE